jgi:GT2 family glycosyltransferase
LIKATAKLPVVILVVDNGSDDDVIGQITAFLTQKGLIYKEYSRNNYYQPRTPTAPATVHILLNRENLGYAAACNAGLKFLGLENFKWFLLLNNDTEVMPDFLINLLGIAERENQVDAWAPVITYYHHPELIWDIGGSLTCWGDRTYPGRKRARTHYPNRGFVARTFLTGCALLIKSEVIKADGFLTEKFFFGEEDYWFAKLMRKKHRRMAVCWEAEIKHKVATSIKKVSPRSIIPLVYIHNLNRLINMKTWLSSTLYSIWKFFYIPYATFLLWWKNWVPPGRLTQFVHHLIKNSRNLAAVTRDDFMGAKDLFR